MQSLLNTSQQPQNPQQPQQEPQIPEAEKPGMNSGGLSFNSSQVEQGIKEQLDEGQKPKLDKILQAGNKILFGKDTHYQILDGMEGMEGEQLSATMAEGALGLTNILFEKSGGTLPPDLIPSAATILMARASEFLNESGIANVTDDVFEQAMHIYSVKLMDKNDPEFSKKVRGGEQPEQQAQPTIPQQEGGLQKRGGGLLNRGGQV
ncbi:MAG: hypothetical protein H6937_02495 [Burkholderiales bacterium]|nr:hypothetical protein [Burkholderiales bacterium]